MVVRRHYRAVELVYLLLRISLVRARLYWRNLILYTISRIALLLLLLTFWDALLENFELASLGVNQSTVLAVVGFYYMVWGVISLLWGIRYLGDYITYGRLDTLLVRPVSMSILLVLYRVDAGCLIQIAFGLTVFAYVVLSLHPPPARLAVSLGLAFEGVALYVLIQAFIGLSTVVLARSEYVSELFDWFYEYSYVPVTCMVSPVREILSFGVPVAFIAVLPGAALTGVISVNYSVWLLLAGLVLTCLWYAMYRIALAEVLGRYESALG